MNLHFNVPVGITLDKSYGYEGPYNPKGPHKTTYNSYHPKEQHPMKEEVITNRK